MQSNWENLYWQLLNKYFKPHGKVYIKFSVITLIYSVYLKCSLHIWWRQNKKCWEGWGWLRCWPVRKSECSRMKMLFCHSSLQFPIYPVQDDSSLAAWNSNLLEEIYWNQQKYSEKAYFFFIESQRLCNYQFNNAANKTNQSKQQKNPHLSQ